MLDIESVRDFILKKGGYVRIQQSKMDADAFVIMFTDYRLRGHDMHVTLEALGDMHFFKLEVDYVMNKFDEMRALDEPRKKRG